MKKERISKARHGRTCRGPRQRGFTLLEMAVATAISSIMFAAMANVLTGSQRDWNRTYQRIHGEVVRDAYAARSLFDKAVRKSTVKKCVIGTGGAWAEVYFYSANGVMSPDRYANFYRSGNTLVVERGQLAPGTFNHASNNSPTTQVVAKHVSSAAFSQIGATLQMYLAMNDGRQDLPVTITAMRHNK